MKLFVPLACFFLVLAYAAAVDFVYREKFEGDLKAKAEALVAGRNGLEKVSIEFRAFDAYLSGAVSSRELRKDAARLVASLPAVRIVSNRIACPGFTPYTSEHPLPPSRSRASDPPNASPELPSQSRSANNQPGSIPLPPPKPSPSLYVSAAEESVSLSGAVDVITRASFFKAIALSGRYLDVDDPNLTVDPDLAPSDWPEELPDFLSFLLTRTDSANLTIDRNQVEVDATAIDAVARDQILRRLDSLEFPGRHLLIDVSLGKELEIPSGAFFFKATLVDDKLILQGRFESAEAKKKLAEICRADLPDFEVVDKIEVAKDLAAPDWAARIPNLVSLVGTRTSGARIAATGDNINVVAEMNRVEAPEDLSDSLSLMIGSDAGLKTRLLSWEKDLP